MKKLASDRGITLEDSQIVSLFDRRNEPLPDPYATIVTGTVAPRSLARTAPRPLCALLTNRIMCGSCILLALQDPVAIPWVPARCLPLPRQLGVHRRLVAEEAAVVP